MLQELSDLMVRDRSPLCNSRPSPVLDMNIQRHLCHFSLATHGFGSPTISAAVTAIVSVLNESLKFLDRTYPHVTGAHAAPTNTASQHANTPYGTHLPTQLNVNGAAVALAAMENAAKLQGHALSTVTTQEKWRFLSTILQSNSFLFASLAVFRKRVALFHYLL